MQQEIQEYINKLEIKIKEAQKEIKFKTPFCAYEALSFVLAATLFMLIVCAISYCFNKKKLLSIYKKLNEQKIAKTKN